MAGPEGQNQRGYAARSRYGRKKNVHLAVDNDDTDSDSPGGARLACSPFMPDKQQFTSNNECPAAVTRQNGANGGIVRKPVANGVNMVKASDNHVRPSVSTRLNAQSAPFVPHDDDKAVNETGNSGAEMAAPSPYPQHRQIGNFLIQQSLNNAAPAPAVGYNPTTMGPMGMYNQPMPAFPHDTTPLNQPPVGNGNTIQPQDHQSQCSQLVQSVQFAQPQQQANQGFPPFAYMNPNGAGTVTATKPFVPAAGDGNNNYQNQMPDRGGPVQQPQVTFKDPKTPLRQPYSGQSLAATTHGGSMTVGPAGGAGLGLQVRRSNSSGTQDSKPAGSDSPLFSPPETIDLVSPRSGNGYVKTVPRNYAPRSTADLAAHEPPPRFELQPAYAQGAPVGMQLATIHGGGGGGGGGDLDPFRSVPLSNVLQPVCLEPADEGAMVPYGGGHTAVVPREIQAARSLQLQRLTSGHDARPTYQAALAEENFPFQESAAQAKPTNHGVVKLKNIPFVTRRAEIIAFLGRNSKILNDNDEPVHIIMERVTSKTNDAYVEFMSMTDAMKAIEKHNGGVAKGRLSRLGDRPVEVELSSQSALMNDLFPLAHGVVWEGARPAVQPDDPRHPWNNFKGFITDEEMTMLVKHVEVPSRSPFSKECPQRPYECMISTLKKMPWYMTQFITVRQRNAIFKATTDLVRLLQSAVRDGRHEAHLTPQLFRRLLAAAMSCPGFSVLQKDSVAYLAGLGEHEERQYAQPRYADRWTHQYTLCVKNRMPLDMIEWYIAVIREETTRAVMTLPLNDRHHVQVHGNTTNGYWGYFWLEVGFPTGADFDNMTLAHAAAMEFNAIQRILRRAFHD